MIFPSPARNRTGTGHELLDGTALGVHHGSDRGVRAQVAAVRHAVAIAIRLEDRRDTDIVEGRTCEAIVEAREGESHGRIIGRKVYCPQTPTHVRVRITRCVESENLRDGAYVRMKREYPRR